MKIEIVDYPNPDCPTVLGTYVHKTKTILVQKNYKNKTKVIIHEFGHYIIDLVGIFPIVKHYLNLSYEYIWVFFNPKIKDKKYQYKWYKDCYSNNAKKGHWVY